MCVLCCVVLLCVGLRCVALGCAGLCCVSCVVCVCVCGGGDWGTCGLFTNWGVWRVVRGTWCVPRLPGFILLLSFGGTLLVVSILGVVYDCHLWPPLRSSGGY